MRYRLECCRIFIIFKNSTTFCFSRWFSYGKADIIPRRYYTTKQVWQSDSMSSTLRQRRTIQLLGFIITPSSHANDVSMSASLRRSRYNLLRTLYHRTSLTKKLKWHFQRINHHKIFISLKRTVCKTGEAAHVFSPESKSVWARRILFLSKAAASYFDSLKTKRRAVVLPVLWKK